MTRQQFNTVFLEHYESLSRWGVRKYGGEGLGIVHQCYINILEHGTFKNGPCLFAKRWLFFKVGREMVRHRKANALRTQKTWEGQEVLVGAMQERELLERPDITLSRKELPHKGTS